MATALQLETLDMQGFKRPSNQRQKSSSSKMILIALVFLTPWLHARPSVQPPAIVLPEFESSLSDDQTDGAFNYFCKGDCQTSQRNNLMNQLRAAASAVEPLPEVKETDYRGSCRMVAAAKRTVKRLYNDRKQSAGKCGTGVGEIIKAAGLPIDLWGRNAINYENYILKNHGWTKLPIYPEYPAGKLDWKKVEAAQLKAIEKAPPGAVLVFSGGCTAPYYDPQTKKLNKQFRPYPTSCASDGDKFGHVAVKGDDGDFYTDGKTEDPSVPHRFLVGIWLPPGAEDEDCHRPYM